MIAALFVGVRACIDARNTRESRMKDSSCTRAHASAGQVRSRALPIASKPLKTRTVRFFLPFVLVSWFLLGNARSNHPLSFLSQMKSVVSEKTAIFSIFYSVQNKYFDIIIIQYTFQDKYISVKSEIRRILSKKCRFSI